MSVIENLSILYRGPLSSCNYDCDYCPFAKQEDSKAELTIDEKALSRFVSWCQTATVNSLSILFTPWGESLTRHWYWRAFEILSHIDSVQRVAVQTNLSCRLDWIERCDKSKLGFWCTWHPGEVTIDRFLSQCEKLLAMDVRFSVGVVGMKQHFDQIEELRKRLPDSIYLWINAEKTVPDYYNEVEIGRLEKTDPLFRMNVRDYKSFGKLCRTGQEVISVDGEGNVFRCHFVKQLLGNIYQHELADMLAPRTCPNKTCECHIGYVHLQELQLNRVFGDGILERIPETVPLEVKSFGDNYAQ